MELDCAVEAPWPAATDWEELAQSALAAVSRIIPLLGNERLCAGVVFADDDRLQALNCEWRGMDKPTNVLSFPMLEATELEAIAADGPPVLFGDIALSFDTCLREAEEKSISLEEHASHLIIHGILHLADFDHEKGDAHAEEMELLEIKALAILGIKDPYG
ncbi:MAG: rRNA maturation RNase YbeY [Sphingomonadaceae bacterium]|nr:rRNA maturation RNase YbeY [Sphingomonadaceae bacterium]